MGLIGLFVLSASGHVHGWGRGGFGGFHAAGFGAYHAGGFSDFRAGGYGGYHASGYGGYREGDYGYGRGGYASYSGYRSGSAYGNRSWGAAGGSYDRTWDGSRGGSVTTSGSRGAAWNPYGAAAGGTRTTTATGPEGRTYSDSSHWGAAATRFPGDYGLAHYSNFGAVGYHNTTYWSHNYLNGWAGSVRGGFFNYHCFTPTWCAAHPLAWTAPGWALATAWDPVGWASLASFCSIPAEPVDYDDGNTIVYQGPNVYVNGDDVGTTQQYSEQASSLAAQGQTATPAPESKWESLGVFALAQGNEQNSSAVVQLALDQAGTIRGNYYDDLMGTTTAIDGQVDKATQRACWTIGTKKEPVFDAGIYNLTKSETPVLVHFADGKTQQWLLVRLNQGDAPQEASASTQPGPAHVTVIVPAGASVFFDGVATDQTGTDRTYVTPELAAGRKFQYEIEARWTAADGTPVDQTRTVIVTAGAKVQVNFTNEP
jgi:uncharacterized protein (TIGR03000 family)